MFHRYLAVFIFIFSACASQSVYTDQAEQEKADAKAAAEAKAAAKKAPAVSLPAPASATPPNSTPTAEQVQQRIEKVMKPAGSTGEKNSLQEAQKPIAAPPANALGLQKLAPAEPATSSEKSLGWLKNGNTRYLKGYVRSDGTKQTDRERVAKGQKPHTVILSCSDSRVPPEVIFDQKLGELLTVRSAGPSLENSSLATIEYAITNLGTKLVVVLGHDACGFVKNAATSEDSSSVSSPFMAQVLNDIRPRLTTFRGKDSSKNYVDEGWANVHGISKDLIERSQIVRDAVLSGDVKIQPALYLLKTGRVEWATQ